MPWKLKNNKLLVTHFDFILLGLMCITFIILCFFLNYGIKRIPYCFKSWSIFKISWPIPGAAAARAAANRLNTVSRTTTRTQTNNAVPSFQAAIRPRNIAGFSGVIRGGGARVPQNVPTFPGAGQTITTITETKTITDGVPDTVAAFPGLYISIMVETHMWLFPLKTQSIWTHMSEWLLLNAKRAIFQFYDVEKLYSMAWCWYRLCSTPAHLVSCL